MPEHIYLLTICLPLGTILLVFGMRYLAVVRQAKAKLNHDQAFRDLVDRNQAALSEIKARLEGIEKILRDVA